MTGFFNGESAAIFIELFCFTKYRPYWVAFLLRGCFAAKVLLL
jgi:hypothetical protein